LTETVEAPAEPPAGCRGAIFKLVSNDKFDTVVLVLVCANAFVMAAQHYGQSDSFGKMLDLANMVFVYIFLVELILRMIAWGVGDYFKDPWNNFDFFIVVGCLIVQFLDATGIPVQAVRPLRLLQVFRMIRRCRGIRLMVGTLFISLPAMFNISCLLVLVIFIWAIIGMQIFANLKFGNVIDAHVNFRTFSSSMLLLVRCITGENWNVIMHDCMITFPDCTNYSRELDGFWLPNDCGSPTWAYLYFLAFYIIGIFTLMNLFVAVILDNFQFCTNVDAARITKKDFEQFTEEWFKRTMADKDTMYYRGLYMKLHSVQEFLLILGSPLGVDNLVAKDSRRRAKLIVDECRVKCDLLDKPEIVTVNPVTDDLESGKNSGETVPLTPKSSSSSALVSVASAAVEQSHGKKQQLLPDEIPTAFEAIGYKKMQYLLVMHTVGLDPLPYEDRVNREREVSGLALERSATLITSVVRGQLERIRSRKAEEKVRKKLEQGTVNPKSFGQRFVEFVHSPEEQKKIGLVEEEVDNFGVQKRNLWSEMYPEMELEDMDGGLKTEDLMPASAQEKTAPVPPDTSKIQGIFAERAKKRKQLREKKRKEFGEKDSVVGL